MLDSLLESDPGLLPCAVLCADCGIRFLTHPRNARRIDLRCPFGCRRHHRRRCTNQRTAAYYSTPNGKRKKDRFNSRRKSRSASTIAEEEVSGSAPSDPTPASLSSDEQVPAEASTEVELQLEGLRLDESSVMNSPMLPYVRIVVSVIEGVRFSCQAVIDWLRRSMRQRSIAKRRRVDYVLAFLHQHPP